MTEESKPESESTHCFEEALKNHESKQAAESEAFVHSIENTPCTKVNETERACTNGNSSSFSSTACVSEASIKIPDDVSYILDEASADIIQLPHKDDCAKLSTGMLSITFSSTDETLPSRIIDKPYIYCYNKKKIDADDEKKGKWLMYRNIKKKDADGKTKLDKAWQKAVKLVKRTELPIIKVKCSTAYERDDINISKGIIMFYTPDYSKKEEVRAVAEEIYLRVCRTSIIYKTDEASRLGMYLHHGKKQICIYKFEYGKFMERCSKQKWITVEDSSNSISIPVILTHKPEEENADDISNNDAYPKGKLTISCDSSKTSDTASVSETPAFHATESNDAN
ncbi:hypothetical protein X975_20714, partial [Stegodyphus mimosarum]